MGLRIHVLCLVQPIFDGHLRTPKFMFSKIKKSGIGIRIPITPIWVELQNPIFWAKIGICISILPRIPIPFWCIQTRNSKF